LHPTPFASHAWFHEALLARISGTLLMPCSRRGKPRPISIKALVKYKMHKFNWICANPIKFEFELVVKIRKHVFSISSSKHYMKRPGGSQPPCQWLWKFVKYKMHKFNWICANPIKFEFELTSQTLSGARCQSKTDQGVPNLHANDSGNLWNIKCTNSIEFVQIRSNSNFDGKSWQ
jgi:hypothetical protein